MHLKAAIIGAGSWGTTIASLMAANGPARLWARDPEVAREINTDQRNRRYLEDAALSEKLVATADIDEAVEFGDVVVMAVPSKAMRITLTEVARKIRPWVPVISLAKGLEPTTNYRMTQIINEVLPGQPPGVLTGPNLAREILAGYSAASTLAMEDETVVRHLRPLFQSTLFRVYSNTDVVGCELGGAFKNVIAIAAGMGDGIGAGENTRSALITRGLAEMTRLGTAMGGRAETFAGLAGLGDLLATCTSNLSRNHTVGMRLGQGQRLDTIIAEMNQVAEGVKTSRMVEALAAAHDLDMPISHQVYRVCHEGITAREAFMAWLRREAGNEAEPG
ncbi:MAG: NAD(P)H-dependent glycerol-3-phosphate dehydrogenase [Pseudomonadota bacterium]